MADDTGSAPRVAVVIPCFRVRSTVADVIKAIGSEVCRIYVVDDACPEITGDWVESQIADERVTVLRHDVNRGVGGAVITGYQAALEDKMDIVVKIDGDGQMNPKYIPQFIRPIIAHSADYTKGNRFFSIESLVGMPWVRIFGNTVLSFLNKAVSGYWNLMDPTNGFTAIHTSVLAMIPLEKLEQRYFFESDMLFRLNTLRAVVQEIPMDAVYEGAESNLSIHKVTWEFPGKYCVRFFKRIFYNYFLRDFNICTLEIISGSLLFAVGLIYGAYNWLYSYRHSLATPVGTVMLAALLLILGFQLLLSAVSFDAMNIPKEPLHQKLGRS